jgi:hypothetical protein
MFRLATPQNTRRARPVVGTITPLAIPIKGMNARDAFAVMGPQYAISLSNVIVENYGLRTRRGYAEYATGLPGALPVWTVMSYYPALAPAPLARQELRVIPNNVARMMLSHWSKAVPPVGKLFAATNSGRIYDVTAGGAGPWTPEAGVLGLTDFWTWLNFQNIAGSFLVVTNDGGGYSYYNGTAWATPVEGTGIGEIDGADPSKFCFVMVWKKRLWFIEKDHTRAWYLPVGQLTGQVTEFNFGEQFRHGGHLAALANWTVDGGEGIDDHLIAVGSQGDVVVYKGVDPDDPTSFGLHGVWSVGALPAGRRSVINTGGDIQILSHFGVTPLSALLSSSQLGDIEDKRLTYVIAPLIARLMRDYSALPGWAIRTVARDELLLIRVPDQALEYAGQFFALKVPTGGWSALKDLPYRDLVTVDAEAFAGSHDGRVLRAFEGPLDNVKLGETLGDNTGVTIISQVTPSYQAMGDPGLQKVFKLVRPTFITTMKPTLTMQVLVDYGPPRPPVTPTLPDIAVSLWDVDLWDSAIWSGLREPIKEWLGCHGVGFVGTVQLDYRGSADTLLASIDFWTEQGGVM